MPLCRSMLVSLPLLILPGLAQSAFLGDAATFQVNINADGTFGQITLRGILVDSAVQTQRQFVNGQEFSDSSTVEPAGPVAVSYSVYINDNTGHVLRVDVVTNLLGDYPGISQPTAWFEQFFTFTNVSGAPQLLNTVSYVTPNLNGDQDPNSTVSGDGTVLVAVDTTVNRIMLMATWPTRVTTSAQVAAYNTIPYPTQAQDLTGDGGPYGPGETEMALGVDLLTLADGASASLTFRYLYGLDMTDPPPGFPAPAPGTLALIAVGAAALQTARRRSPSK